MLSIPSVPTDNLYKFLAISGVAMIVAGYALMTQNDLALRESVAKEFQAAEDRFMEFNWKNVDGVRLDHVEKSERTRELNVVQPMIESYGKSQFAKAKQRTDEMKRDAVTVNGMLWFLIAVGTLSAGLGFQLWWTRVQWYQDGILKAQYDQEIKKAKSS